MLVQGTGLFDKNGNTTSDPATALTTTGGGGDPTDLALSLAKMTSSHSSSSSSAIGYHVNDLPDEVLARVFGYLHPIAHELPALALVCSKWRRLLADCGSLWRDLHVDPRGYRYWHFSLLCAIFRLYGTHVQRLTWYEHAPVYESVFSLIPRLSNLRQLRLPILWTAAVVQSLQPLARLQHVQLNGGFSLNDQDLARIAQSFPDLKVVSLNACWQMTARGLKDFLSSLQNVQALKLKINSGLPLSDVRSERAMREGLRICHAVTEGPWASLVSVLCLHFVPIEMEELWCVVKRMTSLRKLSVSNCEHLHGIRLVSESLHKLYLFNLWNVVFVSVEASELRHVTIDQGLESLEHLQVRSPRLRRVCLNGSNVLRTLNLKGGRLTFLELSNCEELDMRTVRDTLYKNPKLVTLRLGCLSVDSLLLDEDLVPALQEVCLLGDFSCEAVHVRAPSLRLFHTEADNDIITLNHIYVTANHLCKVALVGMPALKTLTVQCVSVDSIELNLCSDDQLVLDSCVIQALGSIGFLRLFDCKVNLLSVSTPLARTVVLYRCHMTDYVLQMALHGCPNIAHLNLEKCRNITQVGVEALPLKFLNLFGCRDVHRLELACPHLLAINVGQCPNVRLFLGGVEQALPDLCRQGMQVVLPNDSIRWTHDYPPQLYVCS